jgi:hypothetical protein
MSCMTVDPSSFAIGSIAAAERCGSFLSSASL